MTDIKGEVGLRECNVVMRRLGDRMVAHRDPVELACDLFAAELLMPLEVLDRLAPDPLWGKGALPRQALEDEFDALASRFNVPRGFAKWRCFDLHALRQSHFNPLR
jgi:Zn-dependent peptidase ImmA (M78 family)